MLILITQKNVMQLQNRYLQCPVVLNDRGPSDKWPWWRLRDLGPRSAYREAIQNIMVRWHHREPIGDNDDVIAFQSPLVGRAFSSSPFPFPSHLPRFHTGMFNEMYHTVSSSSSSCKGVMRHAKFILKPKIQKFRCYKLDRVLSN